MAHHENSHDDHGHDMTEGNRQYYPKGWYVPLVGLFVVAFFISLGAGALLGISGTDKWGKSEQCCADPHCSGDCEHHDATAVEGDHHEGDHHDTTGTSGATADGHHNDSVNVAVNPPADSTKVDSPKKAEPAGAGHEGHGH